MGKSAAELLHPAKPKPGLPGAPVARRDGRMRPFLRDYRANQQLRLIRDNRIHAPRCEVTHALGAIHRPHHDLAACAMNTFYQFSIDQVALRDYPLRRPIWPTSWLRFLLAK